MASDRYDILQENIEMSDSDPDDKWKEGASEQNHDPHIDKRKNTTYINKIEYF